MSDLEGSIKISQEAFDTTPLDHPEFPDYGHRLQSLAIEYRGKFRRTGTMSDLEKSIELDQEAVHATPADHPERIYRLQSLAIGYSDRFRRTGAMSDLERSIELDQEAVDTMPLDHPDRAYGLQSLAAGYSDKYQRTGTMSDLEDSIELSQEAVDTMPPDHPYRSYGLQTLAVGHSDRFRRTGAMSDLERSIELDQEAVDTTLVDHPDRAPRLQSLATAYRDRFRRTGTMSDLERSIELDREAVDTTPADHPDRAQRLQSLAGGYSDRFQSKGAMLDLERSIELSQRAVDTTPLGHPDRARRLQGLAVGYGDRFRRTGAMSDLERSIELDQEAVDVTPTNHPDRAYRLQTLAVGYRDQYQRTRAISNLDRSIELSKEAIDTTPADHPDRAHRLQTLAVGYRDRFRRTGKMSDLERSIKLDREAVDTTPAHHPDRARRLQSLAVAYSDRYQRTRAKTDEVTCLDFLCDSLNSSCSPIRPRLSSGKRALELYASKEDWQGAYGVARTISRLIPLLAPKSLEASDKQHFLSDVSGLPSDAAAVALASGKEPFIAIELLELSRGIITGALDEMRADVLELEQQSPLLAQDFIDLRDQLDAPTISNMGSTTSGGTISRLDEVGRRHAVSQRFEQVIADIRNVPGFQKFLLPLSSEGMKAAATKGPIVIINVSSYRCDAIMIQNDQVHSILLPDLSIEDVRARATQNLSRAQPELLEWIWDSIARPVLDVLGLTNVPVNGHWPRIWWIPTGPLVRFPIHAAGYHAAHSSDTVLDRVVSSYSSSVKSILRDRSPHIRQDTISTAKQIVLIAMPDTPSEQRLEFATAEIDSLSSLCGSHLQTYMHSPSQEEVLAALKTCDIFHFAGHSATDSSNPLKSQLLLHDWKQNPLTVANILEINLQQRSPFLAYLSACGTGRVKNMSLIDENVHLISAFKLCGFRHVIGTLWEVDDQSCVEIAGTTYRHILESAMSDRSVSWGLHQASRILRDEWIGQVRVEKELGKEGRSRHRDESMHDMASNRGRGLPNNSVRDQRDVVPLVDAEIPSPLHWVSYVHFGV